MADPALLDLTAAAQRLRDILQTRVDGDYGPTTVLGDLVVDPHTLIYADLAAQIQETRKRQSLTALRQEPASADTDDAVDGVLSNVFVDRDAGTFARGAVTLHFTQRVDSLLPRTTRFNRTASLVYYLDATEDVLVSASSLRPAYDTLGRVSTWTTQVNLIAARTGVEYNGGEGRFTSFDPVNPYLSMVVHAGGFAGGNGIETSRDLIARAETAMSLRSMINARSNDATLRAVFPEIQEIVSIGARDPEMARDNPALQGVSALAHLGGAVDLYMSLPVVQVTERLTIGALADRADGRVLTLRESAPPSGSYVTAGVRVGDVLVVSAGLPEAPTKFKIVKVSTNELDVASALPFSTATEDLSPVPSLQYSVGRRYPSFADVIPSTLSATAVTSRRFAIPGSVILPGRPTYAIRRIEVPQPAGALVPFADVTSGEVIFSSRINQVNTTPPTPGKPLVYRVVVQNPTESQSVQAVTLLELGWPGEDLAGNEVHVTYDTLAGFASIANYVSDRTRRPLAASTLARATHPVYVSATIPYQARTTTGVFVDDEAAVQRILDFIHASSAGSLDVLALANEVSSGDTNVRRVYPFTILYELLLPDGRVAKFETEDVVTLEPRADTSARLTNPTDLGLPVGAYHAGLASLLRTLGVSDRVVRYQTDDTRVTLERRS